MPYLKIQTNLELSKDQKNEILKDATSFLSKELGKPERFIMVQMQNSESMIFAGSFEPLAYLELRSIRLPENRTKTLSKSLVSFLRSKLNVDGNRVFINFVNVDSHMWGFDSDTFSKE
jgi:phenylpyruvate tautomerase PptA (4-oxalocrotonate tautomerase family)